MSSLTSVCLRSLPAASRFLPSQLQSVGAAPARERSAPPAPSGSRFPDYREEAEEQKVHLSMATVTQQLCFGVFMEMTHLS